MRSIYIAISFIFLLHGKLLAIINPENGARLNYNQIMFEYNEVAGSDRYVITIFRVDEQNKKLQPPVSVQNTSLACIISGFDFGKSYSWYYEAFKDNKSIFKSEDFRFSINTTYLIDTSLFHIIINTPYKGTTKNEIFFLDYRGIAIDRQGKPVWFYPFTSADDVMDPNFRNLRMTKDGTILMINDAGCFEIGRNGNNVWIAPLEGKISGDNTEYYHHDFRKLDDGSYLTTSYQYKLEPNIFNPTLECRVRYNTLIQYDASGKVLWHWNEKDHVAKEVIFGIYTPTDTSIAGTHLNAFDYDVKEDAIVISCRHNSSIVKIDKKTGKILYTLGIYDNKKMEQGITPPFLHQHGMAVLPGKRLLIYDNNAGDRPDRGVTYPRVMIIQEPENGKNEVNKVWEFECRSRRFPQGIMGKGGYATPLPNGNILVCMGGANYIFEVTPEKEVVWECSFEKFNKGINTWSHFINYRSTYSSSLYPYYFTWGLAQLKDPSPKITVNNEGTENDQYLLTVKSEEGKTILSRTFSLKSRSSETLTLPIKKKYSKTKLQVTVMALSGTNYGMAVYFYPGTNKPASGH